MLYVCILFLFCFPFHSSSFNFFFSLPSSRIHHLHRSLAATPLNESRKP